MENNLQNTGVQPIGALQVEAENRNSFCANRENDVIPTQLDFDFMKAILHRQKFNDPMEIVNMVPDYDEAERRIQIILADRVKFMALLEFGSMLDKREQQLADEAYRGLIRF